MYLFFIDITFSFAFGFVWVENCMTWSPCNYFSVKSTSLNLFCFQNGYFWNPFGFILYDLISVNIHVLFPAISTFLSLYYSQNGFSLDPNGRYICVQFLSVILTSFSLFSSKNGPFGYIVWIVSYIYLIVSFLFHLGSWFGTILYDVNSTNVQIFWL